MDKKTRPVHVLTTRDLLQVERHTQNEKKMMEKDISYKWKPKKAKVANLVSH